MIRQFSGFKIRMTVASYKLSYLPQNIERDDKETHSKCGEAHRRAFWEKSCEPPPPMH